MNARAWIASCLVAVALGAVGCVPERGGWSVEALQARGGSLEDVAPDRLGDMLPFPVLEGVRVALVACRYPDDAVVRVAGAGADWPEAWARQALEVLDGSLERVALALDDADRSPAPARIRVAILGAHDDSGPSGLGDTLSACDVSRRAESAGGGVRGELVGAEIRMRRSRLDLAGRAVPVEPDQWVGAFLHELGHALGFPGHVAAGDSVLVRDEFRMAIFGRRALRGEVWPEPTLAALYALPTGQRLGARRVWREDHAWLRRLAALRDRRAADGRPPTAVLATVGDESARVVWHYEADSRLVLRFPDWARELALGGPVHAVPDARTRLAMAAAGD